MRRVFSVAMVSLLCLSMFSMFAPKAKADSAYLTDFVQLTTNPFRDREPFWAPDGSKIAYFAFDSSTWYRHIWTMNPDGSGKTQLTFGNVVDESGDYSPDGKKIAFTRYGLRGWGISDIMIMNADGTNIQQITSTGLCRLTPRWSNDGTKLAFYYGGAGSNINEIHIMNADGTDEITVLSCAYPYLLPYWSPDDTKLVYPQSDGIWLVSTSPPYETTHLFTTTIPAAEPVFSPDGKYILFSIGEIGTGQNPIYRDLFLIDANGNFVAQQTSDSMTDYPFDWSPDGHYVAFGSRWSGTTNIWRARIVISTNYQLTVTSTPTSGITFTVNSASKTTPYVESLPEGYYTLEMPQTYLGYKWSKWLEDGDTSRTKTIYLHGTTWTGVYAPITPPVGGEWAPIDPVQLVTPWIALVFLAIAFAAAGSHRLLKKHL